MKKVIALILIFSFTICFCYASTSFLEKVEGYIINYNINLKNEDVIFENPIVLINDRTYVSLRELCEKLNLNVEWNDETNSIKISENEVYKSRSLEDFQFITRGMSVELIHKLVGQPDYYTGSGIMWGVYILEDGSHLHIHDMLKGKVQFITLDKSGKRFKAEFNEDGSLKIDDNGLISFPVTLW